MLNFNEFPDKAGRLNQQIQSLRELVEKNAPATEIGRATAPIHLDNLSRILTYSHRFDVTIGFEFLSSQYETIEEFIPLANTALRMLGELETMRVNQLTKFLDCFGGTSVIGHQSLVLWAEGNRDRQEYLFEFLTEVVRRARRSRR